MIVYKLIGYCLKKKYIYIYVYMEQPHQMKNRTRNTQKQEVGPRQPKWILARL